jgi:hypothetical protein
VWVWVWVWGRGAFIDRCMCLRHASMWHVSMCRLVWDGTIAQGCADLWRGADNGILNKLLDPPHKRRPAAGECGAVQWSSGWEGLQHQACGGWPSSPGCVLSFAFTWAGTCFKVVKLAEAPLGRFGSLHRA